MRRPEDGQIFWEKSAAQIHNLVRALAPPFPCAYSLYGNCRVKIIKTKIHTREDRYVGKISGRILTISNEGVYVLTGKGILLIEEVRIEQGIVKANKVFKSMKIKIG